MQKWQDHADVQKVKQAHSLINHAMKMLVAENGQTIDWDWPVKNSSWQTSNTSYFRNMLIPYLKVQKKCECVSYCMGGYSSAGAVTQGCNASYWKNLNKTINTDGGAPFTNGHYAVSLQNGMSIMVDSGTLNLLDGNVAEGRGTISVDINGLKGPNTLGYDIFLFTGKVIPGNWSSYWSTVNTQNENCRRTSNVGKGCAYWVIYKGNMDYKYRDVSAEW